MAKQEKAVILLKVDPKLRKGMEAWVALKGRRETLTSLIRQAVEQFLAREGVEWEEGQEERKTDAAPIRSKQSLMESAAEEAAEELESVLDPDTEYDADVEE